MKEVDVSNYRVHYWDCPECDHPNKKHCGYYEDETVLVCEKCGKTLVYDNNKGQWNVK